KVAVPPRVPPRLSVPATSGVAPTVPHAAPTAPPIACPQCQTSKPTAAETRAAGSTARAGRRATATARTPSAVPMPTRIPIVYQAPIAGILGASGEPPDHGQGEGGGARAVDDPVVERQAEVPHRANDDLAVLDDGAGPDPVDTEDRDLRMVDQRRHEQSRELSGAGHCERRAAQLLGRQSPLAGFRCELVDVGPQLVDAARVAGP